MINFGLYTLQDILIDSMILLAVLVFTHLAFSSDMGFLADTKGHDEKFLRRYKKVNESLKRVNLDNNWFSDVPLKPVVFSNYEVVPTSIALTKGEHCLSLIPDYNENPVANISSGPLKRMYYIDTINVVWRSVEEDNYNCTDDRKSYPLEIHAVHRDLDDFAEGGDRACRYTILNYLFKVVDEDNSLMEDFILGLKRAIYSHHHYYKVVNPFSLAWLIPLFSSRYFHYKGYFNRERGEWIISTLLIGISIHQLNEIKAIADVTEENTVLEEVGEGEPV